MPWRNSETFEKYISGLSARNRGQAFLCRRSLKPKLFKLLEADQFLSYPLFLFP